MTRTITERDVVEGRSKMGPAFFFFFFRMSTRCIKQTDRHGMGVMKIAFHGGVDD